MLFGGCDQGSVEHGTAVSSSPREPRSEVEWHSVLQTKSRDERLDPGHLLSWLPVEEIGPSGGRGSGGPTETLLFVSSLFLLLTSFFSSVLREGVPQGTRGGDTPPAFALWQMRTMGPGDRTEGCPRSECDIRHERGHPK